MKTLPTSDSPSYRELPIAEIGLRYAALRMIQPHAEAAMQRSFERYGQLSPVLVAQAPDNRYELIDGFKRRRAGYKLGHERLHAQVFSGTSRTIKAVMITVNSKAHTIAEFEKALVIRSLYREDGLSQVEIAALLGRHKSWVCRRLALVERLCDDVVDHLKLGLICPTTGRELAKLPRGNQPEALKTVLKYRFTTNETARLVSMLLCEPRWKHQAILSFPEPILSDRRPTCRESQDRSTSAYGMLIKIERLLASEVFGKSMSNQDEQGRMLSSIERIEEALAQIKQLFTRSAFCRTTSETVKN